MAISPATTIFAGKTHFADTSFSFLGGMNYAAVGLPRRHGLSIGEIFRRLEANVVRDRRYLASVIYRASDIIERYILTRERSERDIPNLVEAYATAWRNQHSNRSGEGTRAAHRMEQSVRKHAYETAGAARASIVIRALQRT